MVHNKEHFTNCCGILRSGTMSVKENVWDIRRSLLTKTKKQQTHLRDIWKALIRKKMPIEEGLSRKMVIPKGEI